MSLPSRRCRPFCTVALSVGGAAVFLSPPGARLLRAGGPPDVLVGRYVVAETTTPTTESGDPAGQTVDIAPRNRGYSVVWRTGAAATSGAALPNVVAGRRRTPAGGSGGGPTTRRGLALRDGDLLGVSLATGGPAYGVAVYRAEDGGRRWRGRWVTSIDGASVPGEIVFETNDGSLTGRHALRGRREGGGGFEGTVSVTARDNVAGDGGENYLLNFTVGGITVYRGLGVRRGERLVVGWSYGSPPALVVYEIGAGGKLDGRRLSLRSTEVITELLAPWAGEGTGPDGLLILPEPEPMEAGTDAAPGAGEATP